MHRERNIYVCPETRLKLSCEGVQDGNGKVDRGSLVTATGMSYEITSGIPNLTYPRSLSGDDLVAREYYEGVAEVYDDVAHLSFTIQGVDEFLERQRFVDLLDLKPHYRVLELACGTGRDSEMIIKRLETDGVLYVQDISRSMLVRCREKVRSQRVPVEFSVGNACHLAFPDKYFDAVFSFGGIGVFGDINRALKEIVRVSKIGATVVVGDESLPPWLYETEFGKILLNNNPLFRKEIPLKEIPVEARNTSVHWVVNGVYYLIRFTVGDGPPKANFDLQIPGQRGGTLRTRFYGRLEGVSDEVRQLAMAAQKRSGKSMFQWLDDNLRKAAETELSQTSNDAKPS